MCSLDLSKLTEPSFIERDAAAVTSDMVAMFEAMTSRTLYPAQPERVEIDMVVQGRGDPMAKPTHEVHRAYKLSGKRYLRPSK